MRDRGTADRGAGNPPCTKCDGRCRLQLQEREELSGSDKEDRGTGAVSSGDHSDRTERHRRRYGARPAGYYHVHHIGGGAAVAGR